ncbi:MAG: hypothetical protein AAF585_21625, partial [Verrucomicrobiota bacterium]
VKIRTLTPGLETGGEWVNLLEGIDAESATLSGSWRVENTTLYREKTSQQFPRFQLPLEIGKNYDLEMTVRAQGKEDVTVSLPIGGTLGIFHMGAWRDYIGLAPVNGMDLRNPNNPTKRQTPLKTGQDHHISIAVRSENESGSILVTVDDEVVVDWVGKPSDLGESRFWRGADPSRISLGSVVPATFTNIRLRSVSVNAPEAPTTSLSDPSQIDPQLTAILEEMEAEILAKAGTDFEASLATLNQNYRALLQRTLDENPDAKLSVQAELDRLDNDGEIEDGDPAGTHQKVVQGREIYRREFRKFNATYDTTIVPILEKQLEKVEALRTEADSASLKKIDEETEKIRARIQEIRGS